MVMGMNLLLFLLTWPNVLNDIAYTITYFLHISSSVLCTKAKFELINISLVPLHVNFHAALPVDLMKFHF